LYKYSGVALEVILALLDKYKNDGIRDLADTKLLEFGEFAKFGSPMKIAKLFGGKAGYEKAVKELEDEIYSA
ncbi:MAG: type I restriction-modification enzyme R subunit C-terminal domain-containing protein, partial [Lachnospiraceae bacterium]|nr:type I restriction-modification enzyme R subunit C-terminal domain-containing protein [Lachnospiraceae bacterium]